MTPDDLATLIRHRLADLGESPREFALRTGRSRARMAYLAQGEHLATAAEFLTLLEDLGVHLRVASNMLDTHP